MNRTELVGVTITMLIVVILVYSFTGRTTVASESMTSSETISANNLRCEKYNTNSTPLNSGSATSGKLFKGEKIADYDGKRLFDKGTDVSKLQHIDTKHNFELDKLICDKWAVVTTIFEPSEAIRRQALIPGWCLVVVGDKKGPASFEIDAPLKNYIFLTVTLQEKMSTHFPLINSLPWNHFGRKNVGYLYAILHGAKVVWDFDDDNNLISEHHTFDIPGYSTTQAKRNLLSGVNITANATAAEVTKVVAKAAAPSLTEYTANEPDSSYDSLVFNPYPLMGVTEHTSWPRGFPLDRIKSNSSSAKHPIAAPSVRIKASDVGIIQSLANHDPDVDAIYRLTQPLPLNFPLKGASVLVPKGSYAPYNAQATLHMYSALWSLLLPVSVHGRVSDIWRGYAAQRIGVDFGMRLAFSPPSVVQLRNPHNYLADLDSEQPLYSSSLRLVEQLNEWHGVSSTVPGRIEELWILLFEHGYLGLKDVELAQAWLTSLLLAGYKFPVIADPNAVHTSHNHRHRARFM